MSGFSDAIVGGVGKLIRSFVQSPNYVAGLTGWSINKDGSTEFNQGLFRGSINIKNAGVNVAELGTNGLIIYDATGAVIARLDDRGITVVDPSTGASVTLDPTSGAYIDLAPKPTLPAPGIAYWNGSVEAFGNGGPDYRPGLGITSPAVLNTTGTTRYARFIMDGAGKTTNASRIRVFADSFDFTPVGGNADASVRIRDKEVVTAPLACFYNNAGTIVSCPAASGAETAMASWTAGSNGNVTVGPGRIAKLTFDTSLYHADGVEAVCQVRIRQQTNSLAANQLGFFRFKLGAEAANVPGPFHGECYVKNTDTSLDKTFTPGLTIARLTGNAVTHTLYGDSVLQCRIIVEDMGLIADNSGLANVSATLV